MTPTPYTLAEIRQSPKLKQARVRGVADFVSEEEIEELREAATEGRAKTRKFDGIDALEGEMIARFGYQFFQDWNAGELDMDWVIRLILAERARDKRRLLNLEALIVQAGSLGVAKKPKEVSRAIRKILKNEEAEARGEV